MTHTEGPWFLDEVDWDVVTQKGFPIANIVHDDGFVTDEQAKADGDLIAAAPDLLVACEAFETFLAPYEHTDVAALSDFVSSAIHAARTGQPIDSDVAEAFKAGQRREGMMTQWQADEAEDA